MRVFLLWLLLFSGMGVIYSGCTPPLPQAPAEASVRLSATQPSLIVLGIAQDGGAPHAGCMRDCCRNRWTRPEAAHRVVSLGVIDPVSEQTFLFEATPDLPAQMQALQQLAPFAAGQTPDGIFLTHAHIGHYTGLMYLGREVLGASEVPVYALPRMQQFLASNGPWDQLVALKNIELRPLQEREATPLSPQLSVTPLRVPHRDEYSETAGYLIEGPSRRVLFIPDIDKWEKWDMHVDSLIATVDVAFLDGTFYQNGEIPGRDMSLIPHPFVEESIARFDHLSDGIKARIHFLHFNHTNPLLDTTGEAAKAVHASGYQLAYRGQVLGL